MWQKAVVEACRSLLYSCAFWLDLSRNLSDETKAGEYHDLVQLLTPVCKAYSTEMGYQAMCLALQVHGGYGYCREYGVEVLLREAKINTIYEGTTGIQALDLLGRKVSMKNGSLFLRFMSLLSRFCETNANHPVLGKYVGRLSEGKDVLAQTTLHLGTKGTPGDLTYPALYATPYCFMFGHVACAYFILNQALVADQKLQALIDREKITGEEARKAFVAQRPDATFYFNKLETAKFFISSILPEVYGIAKSIESDDVSPMEAFF